VHRNKDLLLKKLKSEMTKKGTRNITRKFSNLPDVALNSPIKKENLPLPFVHYPNHYGTFMSFSEDENGQDYFCKCSESAILNYLELTNSINKNGFIQSDWGFQNTFSNNYYLKVKHPKEFEKLFLFNEKLCHRCNLSTPEMRWCIEMYGSNFSQYFGWYIAQTKYRLGFLGPKFLKDKCPDNIIEKLKIFEDIDFLALPQDSEISGSYSKIVSELSRLIENITREEFGFRKIGEGWVSESILFNIVRKLFPEKEILRRYRPDWLNGLELDIYLPELKIAFEYQGQQHFFPIKAWGGKKSFQELKKRDLLKKELCKNLDIKLIEIDYTEPLTEKHLLIKLELKGQ